MPSNFELTNCLLYNEADFAQFLLNFVNETVVHRQSYEIIIASIEKIK